MQASLGAALEVISVLDGLGIEYHLGGSVASTVHGIPRQTLDVDLVAALTSDGVHRFVGLLEERFYVDETMVRQAVARRGSFNLVRLTTGEKIDVFVLGEGDFDREEFRRRVREPLPGDPTQNIWIKSPEDTVLRKLQWFRQGGGVSERQWRDVVGVLKVQGDRLDKEYLDRWAGHLGITDLLAAARSET